MVFSHCRSVHLYGICQQPLCLQVVAMKRRVVMQYVAMKRRFACLIIADRQLCCFNSTTLAHCDSYCVLGHIQQLQGLSHVTYMKHGSSACLHHHVKLYTIVMHFSWHLVCIAAFAVEQWVHWSSLSTINLCAWDQACLHLPLLDVRMLQMFATDKLCSSGDTASWSRQSCSNKLRLKLWDQRALQPMPMPANSTHLVSADFYIRCSHGVVAQLSCMQVPSPRFN